MKQYLLTRQAGFSLVELAVVLVIVALLIGGMLLPLSAQRDVRSQAETQKGLAEIREALIGFAIINGKLPCPMLTTTTDPANAAYGMAPSNCSPGAEGYIPWKTLGVSEVDAWGQKRVASTDPFNGYWRYRLDVNFSTTFSLNSGASEGLSVQDAAGNSLTETLANAPVAVIFSTGPNQTPDGLNGGTPDTTYQTGDGSPTFDDLLIWIGRPLLFSRMVSAGKLP